jgi:hypothetical protein
MASNLGYNSAWMYLQLTQAMPEQQLSAAMFTWVDMQR